MPALFFSQWCFAQLGEYLLYIGVTNFGTKEQKIMGMFTVCDKNHDHKINMEEWVTTLCAALGDKCDELDPHVISRRMANIFMHIDKDNVCIISLHKQKTNKKKHFTNMLLLNRVELSNFVKSSNVQVGMTKFLTSSLQSKRGKDHRDHRNSLIS